MSHALGQVHDFLFARDSPKISGSATELPFPKWGGRVRMLLRKKVRYHVRAVSGGLNLGATVAGKVN